MFKEYSFRKGDDPEALLCALNMARHWCNCANACELQRDHVDWIPVFALTPPPHSVLAVRLDCAPPPYVQTDAELDVAAGRPIGGYPRPKRASRRGPNAIAAKAKAAAVAAAPAAEPVPLMPPLIAGAPPVAGVPATEDARGRATSSNSSSSNSSKDGSGISSSSSSSASS